MHTYTIIRSSSFTIVSYLITYILLTKPAPVPQTDATPNQKGYLCHTSQMMSSPYQPTQLQIQTPVEEILQLLENMKHTYKTSKIFSSNMTMM